MNLSVLTSSEAVQQHLQIIVETYNNGSPTPEFNNAGQIFNHDFYWESISPEKREPSHSTASSRTCNRVSSSSSCRECCIDEAQLPWHRCERHQALPRSAWANSAMGLALTVPVQGDLRPS